MSGDGAPLPAGVRRQRILARLADDSFVHVSQLTKAFGISEVTARTDLDALADEGRLRRVRGGAVPGRVALEHPHELRRAEHPAEKLSIGRLAASLIEPGESLAIDVGTTTNAAAGALVEREDLADLTIFTNGLQIALELERAGNRFTVVVTGGTLRRLQHSLVGPGSLDLLRRVRVDTAFVGCTGIEPTTGFTNVNLEESEVKRLALQVARRRIFLADGSKVGRVDLALICPPEEATMLITSTDANPDLIAELRARGVEVLLAGDAG